MNIMNEVLSSGEKVRYECYLSLRISNDNKMLRISKLSYAGKSLFREACFSSHAEVSLSKHYTASDLANQKLTIHVHCNLNMGLQGIPMGGANTLALKPYNNL